MRKSTLALALVAGLMVLTAGAQVMVPARKKVPTLKESIARETKEKEATVEKFLKALGPAGRDQLKAGQQIELPGLGTLQVVRVEEYKDLVKGVPTIIPARNYIEFVPAAELTTAANAPGAVAAKTVPPYEFRVNPNSAPSSRIDSIKTTRTRAGR